MCVCVCVCVRACVRACVRVCVSVFVVGATYCAVASLVLLRRLRRVLSASDIEVACEWCCSQSAAHQSSQCCAAFCVLATLTVSLLSRDHFFRTDSTDSSDCLLILLGISVVYFFLFSLFNYCFRAVD